MIARSALTLALGLPLLACGDAPRGPCRAPAPGELGSVCGFRHPEDVEAVPRAGVLLVSEMRRGGDPPGGSLAALALATGGAPAGAPRRIWPAGGDAGAGAGDPACAGPPAAATFAPHGIAAGAPGADGAIPVAAVSHGARETVELFALRGAGGAAALRWRGCVPLPPGATGNDVALGRAGELFVSDYAPASGGLRSLLSSVQGGLGLDTGRVLRWQPERGWSPVPGSEGPNPNGVLLADGGASVWASYTGTGAVARIPLAGGAPARFEVAGHPDNLARGARGEVLVAVHTSGWRSLGCHLLARTCRSPWALLSLQPESGRGRVLVSDDGAVVGGVSSASVAGDYVYLGAVRGDRIGVWRAP